jgi:hypothetical protein
MVEAGNLTLDELDEIRRKVRKREQQKGKPQ